MLQRERTFWRYGLKGKDDVVRRSEYIEFPSMVVLIFGAFQGILREGPVSVIPNSVY